eukprot:Rhum_TRINITY_DN14715_c0_g2::Rhum_TRINITY_DN14715_c0_g2_i1::g.111160::m.111160
MSSAFVACRSSAPLLPPPPPPPPNPLEGPSPAASASSASTGTDAPFVLRGVRRGGRMNGGAAAAAAAAFAAAVVEPVAEGVRGREGHESSSMGSVGIRCSSNSVMRSAFMSSSAVSASCRQCTGLPATDSTRPRGRRARSAGLSASTSPTINGWRRASFFAFLSLPNSLSSTMLSSSSPNPMPMLSFGSVSRNVYTHEPSASTRRRGGRPSLLPPPLSPPRSKDEGNDGCGGSLSSSRASRAERGSYGGVACARLSSGRPPKEACGICGCVTLSMDALLPWRGVGRSRARAAAAASLLPLRPPASWGRRRGSRRYSSMRSAAVTMPDFFPTSGYTCSSASLTGSSCLSVFASRFLHAEMAAKSASGPSGWLSWCGMNSNSQSCVVSSQARRARFRRLSYSMRSRRSRGIRRVTRPSLSTCQMRRSVRMSTRHAAFPLLWCLRTQLTAYGVLFWSQRDACRCVATCTGLRVRGGGPPPSCAACFIVRVVRAPTGYRASRQAHCRDGVWCNEVQIL